MKFENPDEPFRILLAAGFTIEGDFVIRPPRGRSIISSEPTPESEAVDYLCGEWDYGYEEES